MTEFQDIGGPIYAIIVLIVCIWLYRKHRDPASDFDLTDILKENGRVSKIAIGYLVTLFTSSWYIVHEAIEKQLTDTAFAAYLATWVVPIVTHLLKSQDTKTSVSSSSVTVTTEKAPT